MKMKKKDHYIDNIFKDWATNRTITPPSYIWDSIEKQLNSNRKNRRMLLLWRSISAAAIIGLVFFAGIFWTNNSKNNLTLTINNEKSSIPNNEINNPKSTSQDQNISAIILNQRDSNTVHSSHKTIYVDSIKRFETKSQHKSKINKPRLVNFTKKKPARIAKIDSYIDVNATQIFNYNNNLLHTYTSTKTLLFSPFNDLKKTKERKSLQITLGGQFSPSYSYREVSSSKNHNTSAAQESGLISYTGGLNLNIKTLKRWSVETGVYYAQVGQKFSNPKNAFSTLSYINVALSNESETDTKSGLNLNNSLGKIKLNNSHDNLQNESVNYLKLGFSSTQNSYSKTQQLTIQQELDFIEIPLVIKYDIIKKAIIFSLAGGISTNFLVGNNAYQIENNSKEKIGETENINNINYSTIFGIGFKTPIWKSIEFNLEPKIRYFMNSVTNNNETNYHPYSIGIYTGISYKFK